MMTTLTIQYWLSELPGPMYPRGYTFNREGGKPPMDKIVENQKELVKAAQKKAKDSIEKSYGDLAERYTQMANASIKALLDLKKNDSSQGNKNG